MIYYLGLGANLGEMKKQLRKAIEFLHRQDRSFVQKKSGFYITAPYGKKDQPSFLNCVIEYRTELLPSELLQLCQKLEKKLGRIKREKWAAREIDIDILFCEDQIINTPTLIIPHPDLHNRKFVLEPLNEISPNYEHPIFQKTIKQLYKELQWEKRLQQ